MSAAGTRKTQAPATPISRSPPCRTLWRAPGGGAGGRIGAPGPGGQWPRREAALLAARGAAMGFRPQLHGKTDRPGGGLPGPRRQRFEPLEQRGPVVPIQRTAAPDYHVAAQRRARQHVERFEAQGRRKGPYFRGNFLEGRSGVSDLVHLVDERDSLADSEQPRDEKVAPGLREQAFLDV